MWCCWISPDDNPGSTPASAVVETGLILWLDILLRRLKIMRPHSQ